MVLWREEFQEMIEPTGVRRRFWELESERLREVGSGLTWTSKRPCFAASWRAPELGLAGVEIRLI